MLGNPTECRLHALRCLELAETAATLESPDALDAVLAAFAAVAVCRNRIAVPPPDNTEEEGWIVIHE